MPEELTPQQPPLPDAAPPDLHNLPEGELSMEFAQGVAPLPDDLAPESATDVWAGSWPFEETRQESLPPPFQWPKSSAMSANARPVELSTETTETPTQLKNEQILSETTYGDNFVLHPAESSAVLTPGELTQRLELDHVAKVAPNFSDQLADGSRTNEVTYLLSEVPVGPWSAMRQSPTLVTESESTGIRKLAARIDGIIADDPEEARPSTWRARSLRENLTFIGQKEYQEAAEGIAAYWKMLLRQEPDLRIWAIANEVSKDYETTKSDVYMLDNILAHFSDTELAEFEDRLVVDEEQLGDDIANVRAVLVDDWTITGGQLGKAAQKVLARQQALGRDFSGKLEAQLLVAPREFIQLGAYRGEVLVRSYFVAHDAPGGSYDAFISGAHSSVDVNFEGVLRDILRDEAEQTGERPTMPAMTAIARPYRQPDYRPTNIERLRQRGAARDEYLRRAA